MLGTRVLLVVLGHTLVAHTGVVPLSGLIAVEP